jgi:3-oxoacyl-[acyl-carrier protein] reductase
MFDLTGRVALITGAGQGVGAGIAVRLAEQGALVAVNDIASDRAARTVEAITLSGGKAISAVADVTDRGQIDTALGVVTAELGPVDILVMNAGIPPSGFKIAPFATSSPADWDPYIAINLFGVMHCVHSVIGPMIERGWGRVVAIVSDAGRFGEPGMAAYAASKAGATGFVRALSKEVGPSGVTCNCISLGSIEAEGAVDPDAARRAARYPMRRLGRPDDIASAVVWLASEEAGWTTGQTISVNGGYLAV